MMVGIIGFDYYTFQIISINLYIDSKMVVVKLSVCGLQYAIEKRFLDTGPVSKLTKLCASAEQSATSKDTILIKINRPPELFSAILGLYVTGDLHIPMTSCPGAFLKEMEFWEIDPKLLSNCCFYRLQRHLEEQRTLIKFHKHILAQEEGTLAKGASPCENLATIRARVWAVVDYRGRNVLDKLYFFLTLLMILLSIMTISLGTCDVFRREMTNCERLEFMKATGMKHLDVFAGLIGKQNCHNSTLPGTTYGPHSFVLTDSRVSKDDDDPDYDYIYVQPRQEEMTVNSTTPGLFRTQPVLPVKVPDMKVPLQILTALDLVTLCFFTLDFIVRLLTCPSIFSYFKSIINMADTAALIGTYMHLVLLQIHQEEKYRDDWIDILALMQMLRSIRLFKLVRNITAARVLVYTFRKNAKDFSILLLFLMVGVSTFSSVLYILENQDEVVKNIPVGWYWALVTMTTVGYGDITPMSVGGKVVSCVCAIAGLLLFALTIPIFVNHFLALYQYANLKCFSTMNLEDKNVQYEVNSSVEMKERVISMVSDETDISHVESVN